MSWAVISILLQLPYLLIVLQFNQTMEIASILLWLQSSYAGYFLKNVSWYTAKVQQTMKQYVPITHWIAWVRAQGTMLCIKYKFFGVFSPKASFKLGKYEIKWFFEGKIHFLIKKWKLMQIVEAHFQIEPKNI